LCIAPSIIAATVGGGVVDAGRAKVGSDQLAAPKRPDGRAPPHRLNTTLRLAPVRRARTPAGITMRITVLTQLAKGLRCAPERSANAAQELVRADAGDRLTWDLPGA
jgi:hypothetical protein